MLSLPKHLYRTGSELCTEATEMLRQAQHDVLFHFRYPYHTLSTFFCFRYLLISNCLCVAL